MFFRTARFLAVAALIFSVSMPWTLLQSIAWVGMTIDHAKGGTLASAIQKTLDGDHPCRLCVFIESGSKTEQSEDAKFSSSNKLELACFEVSSWIFQRPLREPIPCLLKEREAHSYPPYLPPPRPGAFFA